MRNIALLPLHRSLQRFQDRIGVSLVSPKLLSSPRFETKFVCIDSRLLPGNSATTRSRRRDSGKEPAFNECRSGKRPVQARGRVRSLSGRVLPVYLSGTDFILTSMATLSSSSTPEPLLRLLIQPRSQLRLRATRSRPGKAFPIWVDDRYPPVSSYPSA